MPSFKNKIVFLEDIGEEPYRLDGYLAHLFMATDIARAAGFVFAPFYDCKLLKERSPLDRQTSFSITILAALKCRYLRM
jgi:muramoyltetrapeptide carboxypeptidase